MTNSANPLISITLAFAILAGCLGGNGQPQPSTPAPATPASFHYAHNYTAAAETVTFNVPSESTTYNLAAKIGGEGPTVCKSSQDAQLVITRPDGQTYATLTPDSGNVLISNGSGDTGCAQKVDKSVHLPAGKWTIQFSGSGAFIGTLDVTPASAAT